MKGIKLGGIGNLLGRNVEKIGVAVLGLIALFLAWGGIDALRSKSVTSEHVPDAIKTLAQQAATRIEMADAPPAERLPPLAPLGPLLDPWRPQQVKIAPSTIAAAPLARPLVLSARTKRETPAVFPIENLETVSGIAVLQELDDAAGMGRGAMDRGEGGLYGFGGTGSGGMSMLSQGTITPYVIVTGLIPAAKQQAEFLRRLGEDSSGGGFAGGREGAVDRNRPVWTGFRIERQERNPAGGGEFGPWKKIDPPAVAADPNAGRGAGRGELGGGGEFLPMDFRLQDQERAGIAFEAPLPARVVEDPLWGPETVHPWFFRQIVEKRLASGPTTVAFEELRKAPEDWIGETVQLDNVTLVGIGDGQPDVGLFRYQLASDDPANESAEIGTTPKLVFAVSDRWGRSMLSEGAPKGEGYTLIIRIDMVYDTPVARILEITRENTTIGEPDPMSSGEGGMSLGFERGGMDEGMSGGRMGPGQMAGMEGGEYRSFRFFDRTVEPGKEYRYRVSVSINNPNEGLTPRDVADPKTIKVPILTSDFSELSGETTVPSDSLAGILTRSMSMFEYASLRTPDGTPLAKPKSGLVELLVLAGSKEAGNLVLHKTAAKPGDPIAYEKPLPVEEPAATGKGSGTKKKPSGKPDLISTGASLLDVRGEQFTKNESLGQMTMPPEPLEMLILLPSGTFEHVTAIDSVPLVRSHEAALGEILPDGSSSRGEGGPTPRR
jgi:hypothetical protein